MQMFTHISNTNTENFSEFRHSVRAFSEKENNSNTAFVPECAKDFCNFPKRFIGMHKDGFLH